METGVNLTGYDLVIVGLFLLFVIRGLWVGFLQQVTGLLALCLGYYVASQYHDRLFPFLKDISDNPKVVFVASVVILFIVTYLFAVLVGKGLALVMEITFTKWFDKFLGSILGAAKAVVVVVMLHMILGSVWPPENNMLRECQTCDVLNGASDYARKIIRDEEARKSLMQQSPAIVTEEIKKLIDGAVSPSEGEEPPPSSSVK